MILKKTYYSISEVSKLLNIQEHTIRFWDSKLPDLSKRDQKGKSRFFKSHRIMHNSILGFFKGVGYNSLENVGEEALQQIASNYFTNRNDLQKAADEIFEKVKFGKIKIKIYKEYKLEDAEQAHKDLEARKLTGPAILIP